MEKNNKDYDFIYSFELYEKYLISFNCNQMPLNFDQWIQLDIEKVKSSNNNLIKIMNENTYLCLNNYLYVVIESYEKDFNIEFAKVQCKVQKGKKYIPIFPIYHDFYIELNENIKIYIESDIFYNQKPEENKYMELEKYNSTKYLYDKSNNLLFNLLQNYQIVLDNFIIINDNYFTNKNLVIKSGMIFTEPNPIKKIDENKFYFELEKIKKGFDTNNKILNEINLLDNYVQYNFISFYSK